MNEQEQTDSHLISNRRGMEPKINEFFGQNQQIVYDLILEFQSKMESLIIEDEDKKNLSKNVMDYFKSVSKDSDSGMDALFYITQLRIIVTKYILASNFTREILIELISNDYCKRIYTDEEYFIYGIPFEVDNESGYWSGIIDFMDYKKTLITEKDIFGFKNLAIVYEKERGRLLNNLNQT